MWSETISRSKPASSARDAQAASVCGVASAPKFGRFSPSFTRGLRLASRGRTPADRGARDSSGRQGDGLPGSGDHQPVAEPGVVEGLPELGGALREVPPPLDVDADDVAGLQEACGLDALLAAQGEQASPKGGTWAAPACRIATSGLPTLAAI